MTEAVWKCINCRKGTRVLIDTIMTKCPDCGAKYEIIDTILNAHSFHSVNVFRLKGTDKVMVPEFIGFHTGDNEEDIKKYFRILKEQQKHFWEINNEGIHNTALNRGEIEGEGL